MVEARPPSRGAASRRHDAWKPLRSLGVEGVAVLGFALLVLACLAVWCVLFWLGWRIVT